MASKDEMFRSKEAQAVARTTEEIATLAEAIQSLEQDITNARGAYKKSLQTEMAALKSREAVAKSTLSYNTSKFQRKFNTNLSSSDIFSGVESTEEKDETTKKQNSKINKTIEVFGKGANLFVDAVTKLASIDYEREFEEISARADRLMADIDMLSQKALMGASLQGQAQMSAVNSSLTSLTAGVNEGAYASANSLIDLGAQKKIMDLETKRLELENYNTKRLRTEQQTEKFSNLNTQQTVAEVTMGAEFGRLVGHALNDVEISGSILGTGGSISTGDIPGAVADGIANITEAGASSIATQIQHENALYVQKYDNEKKFSEAQLSSVQNVEKTWIEAGANIEKSWLNFAQQIENNLVKSEAAANDLGISFGFSGQQLERFKKTMLSNQVAAAQWGKTLEDIQKIQLDYQEATSRNIQLSTNDLNSTFALDKLSGQDGLSMQLTSAMDIFNHSVSDSNEMFYEMYKNVSKIGLSGRKYLKDLTKNLKLAEKFQFKNGVKGLMDMAKWAQNVRFNMSSLDSIVEGFRGEGLEGAITKAAGMQVLGGGFAMGADPLAMLYEAYMDPKAFAERQNKMMRGIGVFNSKTGEVDFNMSDMMRLEQFAKLSGQSLSDLLNQRRQSVRLDKVVGNLNQDIKWNDKEKSLITNKAQLKNGKWVVTMDNGEDKEVSQLSREDLENLYPQDNEEKLVNYVYDIRDMMTRLTGVKQEANAKLELDGYDNFMTEENKRISNVHSDFETNYQQYLSQFQEKMQIATESQKTMLGIMNTGNENIAKASSDILEQGENIASSLAQVNQMIKSSLNEIQTRDDYKPKPGEIAYENEHIDTRRNLPDDMRFKFTGENFNLNQDELINRAKSSVEDGMAVAANKIVPINDGALSVAKTDPNDTAIFAKTGGPFDTLFNGIFGRINELYNFYAKEVMPLEPIGKSPEILSPSANNGINETNVIGSQRNEITLKPLEIKLSGNIRLESNGQSFDIGDMIKNNPLFIRQISQMLSDEIGKSINGGRSIPQYAYLKQ